MTKIRKEINPDGTFGGNYPYDEDYSTIPDRFIEISEEQRSYIDSNLNKLRFDETQDGIFEDPKGIVDISNTSEYLEKVVIQRRMDFYKDFVKTSLGCIRLKTKIGDFMAVLPNLVYKVQFEGKLAANTIVFYQEPDFNNEVAEESLISYKNTEMTTIEFSDFYLEVMTAYQTLFNS